MGYLLHLISCVNACSFLIHFVICAVQLAQKLATSKLFVGSSSLSVTALF